MVLGQMFAEVSIVGDSLISVHYCVENLRQIVTLVFVASLFIVLCRIQEAQPRLDDMGGIQVGLNLGRSESLANNKSEDAELSASV